MKYILALFLLVSVAPVSQASVVYSGVQNVAVPFNPAGVYLNIATGATSGSQPVDWNTAPWITSFFGGVDFGNDDLVLPAVTGLDQIVNLAPGTVVDSSLTYVSAESGSTTHYGAGSNQFHDGVPGFVGFKFSNTVGGPSYYGWLQMVVSNSSAGQIIDWGYDNVAGTPILAGSVPEPSRALLLVFGLSAGMLRRRRC